MDKHICRQCKKTFNYCRACVFKPIPYKEAGFCSAECSAEFKKPKLEKVIHKDVEVVVIEEDTSTPKEDAIEYPYFFTTTEEDEIEIKEENKINDYEQNHGEDV